MFRGGAPGFTIPGNPLPRRKEQAKTAQTLGFGASFLRKAAQALALWLSADAEEKNGLTSGRHNLVARVNWPLDVG